MAKQYYLQYRVQNITSEDYFIGIPTGKYQLMLGIPWFCKVNPKIN